MKKLITIALILISWQMSAQLYIGGTISPLLNNKLGLNRSLVNVSAEYAIQNTSLFISGSLDKVKIGIIFGNSIQFSCAYIQNVNTELDNKVELGFRYRIKTKQNDFVEIGSYVELDVNENTSFNFIPVSVGFKKCIR